MSTTAASGPYDPRSDELRSIARSIEPAFPTAADTLRAISDTLATRRRDDHAYWADVCTCGMSEQERTGHYPEHETRCEVPSPMDDEATS